MVVGVLAMHGLTMPMAGPMPGPMAGPMAMPAPVTASMSMPADLAPDIVERAHHIQARTQATPAQATARAAVSHWGSASSSPTSQMHQCVADAPRATPGVGVAALDGDVPPAGTPIAWRHEALSDHGPDPPDLHVLCVMRT